VKEVLIRSYSPDELFRINQSQRRPGRRKRARQEIAYPMLLPEPPPRLPPEPPLPAACLKEIFMAIADM
jgi:hypothetical protein